MTQVTRFSLHSMHLHVVLLICDFHSQLRLLIVPCKQDLYREEQKLEEQEAQAEREAEVARVKEEKERAATAEAAAAIAARSLPELSIAQAPMEKDASPPDAQAAIIPEQVWHLSFHNNRSKKSISSFCTPCITGRPNNKCKEMNSNAFASDDQASGGQRCSKEGHGGRQAK